MLGIAAASLALATWRLVRGWRSAADPIIVATSLGVFGAAGALIDGDWSQALGQAAALALAGTSALWAGTPVTCWLRSSPSSHPVNGDSCRGRSSSESPPSLRG
jgi:hypothetical protein